MKALSIAASFHTGGLLGGIKAIMGGGGETEPAPGTEAAQKKADREAKRQAIIDAFRPAGEGGGAEGVNIPVSPKPIIEPIVSELGRIGGAYGGGGGFADNSMILIDVNRQQVDILQQIRDALNNGGRMREMNLLGTTEPELGYA